jgi:hypothetical protein
MAIKHAFTSGVADGGDASLVRPSNWNAAHTGDILWSLITSDPAPAVAGTGYLCDTTAAAFTVTLPAAPTVGDLIAFADAASLFHSNNLTIGRAALNIMGIGEDMVVDIKDATFTLVYASAALGWRIAT